VSGAEVDGIAKSAGSIPESLVNAMAAVFIVGLGAIIGLMAVMKKVVGFDLNIILAITLLSFMLMLVVECVLIRLLLSGRRSVNGVGDAVRLKGHTTQGLGQAQARVLSEPMPSVSEHTTRAFEPIYGERQSE
jgi:hypothetical protein